MPVKNKFRKLILNPRAFLYDSKYPLLRWISKFLVSSRKEHSIVSAVREQSNMSRPVSAATSGNRNYPKVDVSDVFKLKLDLWSTYRIPSRLISNANTPVVAVLPLGVPYIDAVRMNRIENEGCTPLLLPLWEHSSSDNDIDDLEYVTDREPAQLGIIVRAMLKKMQAADATILALPDDSSNLARSLAIRARAMGLKVIGDFPGFAPSSTLIPAVDWELRVGSQISSTQLTEKELHRVRILIGVGGNDAIRLLLLPPRQFGMRDDMLQAAVEAQLVDMLAACAETDHIVVLAKRRKRGFLNSTCLKLLNTKYRKSIVFYDEGLDVMNLVKAAVETRAPVGSFPPGWGDGGRVKYYELAKTPDDIGSMLPPSRQAMHLSDIVNAPNISPWQNAPCDERDVVLARIINGIGLDMIAVPDPLTNQAITEGRQRHLKNLLNARERCYGIEAASMCAEAFIQWGAEPNESKERPEILRSLIAAPRLYLEDGFIRSLGLWTNPNEPTCSVVIDTRSIYYDASRPSLLETILASDYVIDDEAVNRSRRLIDSIVHHCISKYNYSQVLDLDFRSPGKRTILIVDQKAGDMSIKYGAASDESFRLMLDTALELNEVEIVIKQHPCAINGDDKQAHYTEAFLGTIAQRENVHLIGFDVNPYSLINAVDEVWVVSSGMGFEALMAGKPVRCFGVPFYAGWGLTEDCVDCERRSRNRSLEEVFHVFYVMLTRYVHPDTGEPAEIETIINYFAEQIAARQR